MSIVWPSTIVEPTQIDESYVKSKIQTPFEAGYVSSRFKHTKARKRFRLIWGNTGHNVFTSAHKLTLETFFDTYGSSMFDWTNPRDEETYSVFISEDELDFKEIYPGYYQITLTLIEN